MITKCGDDYFFCTNISLIKAAKYKYVFKNGKIRAGHYLIPGVTVVDEPETINRYEYKHLEDKLIPYFTYFPERIYNPQVYNSEYDGPVCYQRKNYQLVDDHNKDFMFVYIAEIFSHWVSVKFKLVDIGYAIFTNDTNIVRIYEQNYPDLMDCHNGRKIQLFYSTEVIEQYSYIFNQIEEYPEKFIFSEFKRE